MKQNIIFVHIFKLKHETSKKFPVCGGQLRSIPLDSSGVLIPSSPPWGWVRKPFEKPAGP